MDSISPIFLQPSTTYPLLFKVTKDHGAEKSLIYPKNFWKRSKLGGFERKSGSKLQGIWKHRFFIVTLQCDSEEDAKRRPREAETDDR